jgi:hypothetical protein
LTCAAKQAGVADTPELIKGNGPISAWMRNEELSEAFVSVIRHALPAKQRLPARHATSGILILIDAEFSP